MIFSSTFHCCCVCFPFEFYCVEGGLIARQSISTTSGNLDVRLNLIIYTADVLLPLLSSV